MLTIETRDLLAVLKHAKKLVPTKCTIPVLACARVFGKTLTVTDLDMELLLHLPVAAEQPFLVPVADLLKILQGAESGSLTHITGTPGDVLTVTVGDMSADLESLPESDWPVLRKPVAPVCTVLDLPEGQTMLKAIAPCISTEATRYYLNGVNFRGDGAEGSETLTLSATDGHKLGEIATALPYAAKPAILPTSAVKLVLGLPAGALEIGVFTNAVHGTGHLFQITGPGWALWSKVVDGTFPDTSRIIPKDTTSAVAMPCDKLKSAASRLNKLNKGVAVLIDPSTGKVTQRGAESTKQITIAVPMSIEQGEPDSIAFNPAYLVQVMDSIALFDDLAVMHLQSAGDPARFEPDAQPDFGRVLFVVLPVRKDRV